MMHSSVHIRPASFADLGQVSSLFDQYRVYYGQASDPAGAKQFLFDLMERRESVIYLAIDSERENVVGFAQMYPVFSSLSMRRVWILNDLFVAGDLRGQGIGRRLLAAVTEYAALTKAKGIQLETGVENKGAQKLYERLGFVRDDEFYHYFLNL
ncbi:GNAT family N-acetyltransferase [Paenibacillus sp. M1]|uniref:GNAT family N-acetyltransferase n=1 Tax=Paenibacillus haidiansis TaxID=1574488 RepID=A0ABU7VU72_9BACL